MGRWGKDYIVELVIGGAKSYSYKTKEGKVVVKQKGITLDRANDKVINFETLKDMVLNCKELKSKERHQFKWDCQTKDIVIKYIARSIKSTVKENARLTDTTQYLFGYVA